MSKFSELLLRLGKDILQFARIGDVLVLLELCPNLKGLLAPEIMTNIPVQREFERAAVKALNVGAVRDLVGGRSSRHDAVRKGNTSVYNIAFATSLSGPKGHKRRHSVYLFLCMQFF